MDAELIAYLDRRFEQIDRRFEQVDHRFEQVDQRLRELYVLYEATNDQIGLVAEGVLANNQATQTLRAEMNREFEEVKAVNRLSYFELERRWLDHERRITNLESR